MHERNYRIQRVINELTDENVDREFVNAHLYETRGPVHKNYSFRDIKTWRIPGGDFNPNLTNRVLLMYGLKPYEVCDVLEQGFKRRDDATHVFGNKGYYFVSCSTKAANISCRKPGNYARSADSGGKDEPEDGDTVYIMLCEVGLGKVSQGIAQEKNGIVDNNVDSMIFTGLYCCTGMETVTMEENESEYELKIPRGPIMRNMHNLKATVDDQTFFYFDEFYVEDLNRIRPRILIKAECAYNV